MGREILGYTGKPGPQKPKAGSGGMESARDVRSYRPPQGPTNIGDRKSPGLHGHNHGNSQQAHCGSESGGPGLGGSRKPHGSQR